jgi:hypothetical protein
MGRTLEKLDRRIVGRRFPGDLFAQARGWENLRQTGNENMNRNASNAAGRVKLLVWLPAGSGIW